MEPSLRVAVGTWLLEHKWVLALVVAVAVAATRALFKWQAKRNELQLRAIERAALGVSERELELAAKLLQTLHLSVAERKELPHGRMCLSALVSAARAELAAKPHLPARLAPTDDFAGVVLEQRDSTYIVHTQHEIGVGRYGPKSALVTSSLKDAVSEYVAAKAATKSTASRSILSEGEAVFVLGLSSWTACDWPTNG